MTLFFGDKPPDDEDLSEDDVDDEADELVEVCVEDEAVVCVVT